MSNSQKLSQAVAGGANPVKASDIGTSIQAYDADLTSWAGIAPSAKQDYDADTAKTDVAQSWSAQQTFAKSILETKTAIAASAIDVSLGSFFTKTISGTTTFTVSNVPAAGTTASFILELTNGGSATINWFSGMKWANGQAPTLTTSGVDILGFYTHDGGTTWRGLILAKDSR